MRSHVRVLLAAPLIGAILALVAVSAPAAQAAPEFGVEKFSAANCTATHEGCAGEETTLGLLNTGLPRKPPLPKKRFRAIPRRPATLHGG